MLKQIINAFLFFALCLNLAHAQNCYHLSIQKYKTEDKQSKFYFTSVIDGRPDTSKTIGQVYIGNLNIRQCAAFKKNVSITVLDFLQKTYTNKNAAKYIVKINQLEVDEHIHKNEMDTGIVFAELEFYQYNNTGELIFVTKISKTISDVFEDATYSHDNRLKRCLMAGVNEFAHTLMQANSSFTLKTNIDEIRKTKPAIKDSISIKNSDQKPGREPFKTLLQLQGYIGWSSKGMGIRASVLFFLKNNHKVAVGPSLFWNYFTLTQNVDIPNNVTALSYNFGNIGMATFTRLNKYLGATVDGYFLLGTEKITTSTPNNYFYFDNSSNAWYYVEEMNYKTTIQLVGGFHLEEGIQFMRQEKRGVNVKLSIYETVLTADYFETDIGVKINLGINF